MFVSGFTAGDTTQVESVIDLEMMGLMLSSVMEHV